MNGINDIDKIIRQNAKQIELVYDKAAEEIKRAIIKHSVKQGTPFGNYNKALHEEILRIFEQLNASTEQLIKQSVELSYQKANTNTDNLVTNYLKGFGAVSINPKWVKRNTSAMNAFLNRSRNGLNLSGRIWNLSKNVEKNIIQILQSGILDGTSSADLSRIIKQALKNPNALFRRVKNADGELVLSKSAKKYKPGRGVYRSAFKNALRLAGTEINMSYRFAENLRYQQIPFIIGYEVHLSNNHDIYDICDNMKGKYPKTFVFIGWHPNCRCYVTSIMLSDSEFKKYLKTGKISASNYIKNLPEEAVKFLNENKEKINGTQNLPYWFLQNSKFIEDLWT